MKKYFILIVCSLVIIIFTNSKLSKYKISADKDWTECLKKYDSKWGEDCVQCKDSKNSYRVSLRNICSEKIDAKVAVQESYKRWKTFLKTDMAPNDTIVAYACNGTGKYLYWVNKAGDKSTALPSDDEINAQYTK